MKNFLLLSGILAGVIFLGRKRTSADNDIVGIGRVKSASLDDLLFDRHKWNKKYVLFDVLVDIDEHWMYEMDKEFTDIVSAIRYIDSLVNYKYNNRNYTFYLVATDKNRKEHEFKLKL